MSIEVLTLKDELQRLEQAHKQLLSNAQAFVEFMSSPEAFNDDAEFERKLTAVQVSVTMIAELTVPPSHPLELVRRMQMMEQPQQPPPQAQPRQAALTEHLTETGFTVPKAVASAAAILASTLAVEKALLPPAALMGVVGAVLAFAFAPQLSQLVKSFMAPKSKPEEGEELRLEDIEKISAQFSYIRQKYISDYFLIRWQGKSEEPIPETFEGLGYDKMLVNRGEYISHTDSHNFIDIIGKIVNACEKSIWQRKTLIVNAMVQSQAAMAIQR